MRLFIAIAATLLVDQWWKFKILDSNMWLPMLFAGIEQDQHGHFEAVKFVVLTAQYLITPAN